ncbi:MAG: zinc-ribbon domain-containing protein, partial [Acidobacteriaceae bacterium]
MTICPKCNAENRPEAAFCSRCGTILLIQPAPAEPVDIAAPMPEPAPPTEEPLAPVEQAVYSPPAIQHLEGSVFGGRYKYDALIYQDEHEMHYTVTELCDPPAPSVRICSNPACRAIHSPLEAGEEKFCTCCGSPMEQNQPLLMIMEADRDRFSDLQQIIGAHLAHPNIHPPLASFQQETPGGVRYCLVSPYSQELPSQPEVARILEWGIQLASGLDYLHSRGIAFGEEVDPGGYGLAEGKIVWRNFSQARILPMLTDREKINNVRQLALSLYAWMTGKSTYQVDPALSPGVNEMFQRALVGEGFTSGAELARHIEQAIKSGVSPLNITYQVGQRTHAGKKRAKNEDSQACISLSRTINGIAFPIGMFAVADGMGGHATGEQASKLAIESLTQKALPDMQELQNRTSAECTAWLKARVQSANQAVYQARQDTGSDMGSTMVCVLMVGSQAHIAHL